MSRRSTRSQSVSTWSNWSATTRSKPAPQLIRSSSPSRTRKRSLPSPPVQRVARCRRSPSRPWRAPTARRCRCRRRTCRDRGWRRSCPAVAAVLGVVTLAAGHAVAAGAAVRRVVARRRRGGGRRGSVQAAPRRLPACRCRSGEDAVEPPGPPSDGVVCPAPPKTRAVHVARRRPPASCVVTAADRSADADEVACRQLPKTSCRCRRSARSARSPVAAAIWSSPAPPPRPGRARR